MPQARLFTPDNPLSRIMIGADVKASDSLAKKAEANVDTLKGSIETYVQAKLVDIYRLSADLGAQTDEQFKSLSDAALAVSEVAGAAGLASIGEAARGLKLMMDAFVETGVAQPAAMSLHVEALSLFSTKPPPPASTAAALLSSLKAMRRKLGVV